MFLLLLFVCFIISLTFKRYAPVFGIHEWQGPNEDVFYLDIRNYQTSYREPIQGALNIPYAYLKRNYREIPNEKLVIITSDSVEKNLAIRLLIKKDFKIAGYVIIKENKQLDIWNTANN